MGNSNQQKNELKSLEDIFKNGKRIFRIPDYQRGYSWEKQQRADLLKDIEYLIKSGYEYRHYTGTIVASKNKEETKKKAANGYEVFDVVDGQQRMTSLILLLSVICRELKKPAATSEYEHKDIFSKFIQSGPVGNPERKLWLGKEQDILFEDLVTKGKTSSTRGAESKSDQNLIDAVEEYEERLNEKWLKGDDVNMDRVLKCVCKNLGFLLYAPENKTELGIMFEVINNRGKALTELEKIKNYLIYYAAKNDKRTIRDRVNTSWSYILSDLNKIKYTSNEEEDRFLRNCWIVFMDRHKSRSHRVYDGLKQKWPPDGDDHTPKILRFIDFLKAAAMYYTQYLNREGVNDKKEAYWLERISRHKADASITPLILAIFSKVEDQQERTGLFELLEKLNFRYYGTGIAGRSDSGQGELFGYANQFFNEKEDGDGNKIDVQWLKNKLTEFIGEQAPDKKFVEYLTLDKDEAFDYHTWNDLKFFLASYEEKLNSEEKKSINLGEMMAHRDSDNPNDFYHQEHIWAKGDDSKAKAYKDVLKAKANKKLNVNKRRLGNFMLLNEGLNILVSDDPPEVKINKYFKVEKNTPKTLMIKELKDFFQ